MEEKITQTIIKRLGENYRNDMETITDLITDYTQIVCDVSGRDKNDAKIVPIVKQAVISSYLRLGDEGTTSSNEGSLSSSYLDIEEKIRKDAKSIRIFK